MRPRERGAAALTAVHSAVAGQRLSAGRAPWTTADDIRTNPVGSLLHARLAEGNRCRRNAEVSCARIGAHAAGFYCVLINTPGI